MPTHTWSSTAGRSRHLPRRALSPVWVVIEDARTHRATTAMAFLFAPLRATVSRVGAWGLGAAATGVAITTVASPWATGSVARAEASAADDGVDSDVLAEIMARVRRVEKDLAGRNHHEDGRHLPGARNILAEIARSLATVEEELQCTWHLTPASCRFPLSLVARIVCATTHASVGMLPTVPCLTLLASHWRFDSTCRATCALQCRGGRPVVIRIASASRAAAGQRASAACRRRCRLRSRNARLPSWPLPPPQQRPPRLLLHQRLIVMTTTTAKPLRRATRGSTGRSFRVTADDERSAPLSNLLSMLQDTHFGMVDSVSCQLTATTSGLAVSREPASRRQQACW